MNKNFFHLDIYPHTFVEHLLELLTNKSIHRYHLKFPMHQIIPVSDSINQKRF